jgi:hypothetical protein
MTMGIRLCGRDAGLRLAGDGEDQGSADKALN